MTSEAADDPGGYRIIGSPYARPGTAYVIDPAALLTAANTAPLVWRDDPFDAPPDTMTLPAARAAWHVAHRHLEQLLDGLCADVGLDPEVAWRGPRADEQRARRVWRYVAETRAAFAIAPPSSFVRITDGSTS